MIKIINGKTVKQKVDDVIEMNQDKIVSVLYRVIKYEFPDIQNLQVRYNPDTEMITTSFNEGKYTADQIREKVNEYRNPKELKDE